MSKEYLDKIAQLTNFEKEDILNRKFLLEDDTNIKIYYAPHNEFINKQAKILIVGIHPSGANGHRKEIFQENKKNLINIINNINID